MNNRAVLIGLSVLAFLIALLLVIAIGKLLFGGRLRMPGGRTRQARLGIVDAFDLDRQRQLIIVRRDNTEHLIMIGGPNDLLIESEIVRIEARDVRPRDKGPEVAPAQGDRIPAPFAPVDRQDVALVPQDAPPPRPEEPLLPMPLPRLPAETTGPKPPGDQPLRTPTFPLPPRRPAAPAPAPERRPLGPPRLPEGVLRETAPPPPPVAPVPPQIDVAPPAPNPAPPAPVAPKPPFLKPLGPRPPIRPLNRVTPQAPSLGPQDPAPPAPPKQAPVPPAPKPQDVKPQELPVAAKPAEEPQVSDALDSLEEEMAKLLGRGPGG